MPQNAFNLDSRIEDEQLRKDFYNFWIENGLLPALTNAHQFEPINVSYTQAKAVVNSGGAYRSVLLEFADVLHINDNSRRYEDSLADMLYQSNTLQKYVNFVKEILPIMYELDEDDGRQWYIVWYAVLDN